MGTLGAAANPHLANPIVLSCALRCGQAGLQWGGREAGSAPAGEDLRGACCLAPLQPACTHSPCSFQSIVRKNESKSLRLPKKAREICFSSRILKLKHPTFPFSWSSWIVIRSQIHKGPQPESGMIILFWCRSDPCQARAPCGGAQACGPSRAAAEESYTLPWCWWHGGIRGYSPKVVPLCPPCIGPCMSWTCRCAGRSVSLGQALLWFLGVRLGT